jgi:hypothetical protein
MKKDENQKRKVQPGNRTRAEKRKWTKKEELRS